jgi:hypothetical protein
MSEDDICALWGDRHSFKRHIPDINCQLFKRDMLANSDSDKKTDNDESKWIERKRSKACEAFTLI